MKNLLLFLLVISFSFCGAQNLVPNPFAEQTSISYFVPESAGPAQIVFTDMLGNAIKTAEVKSGYGIMTVFASNLSSGQYNYSIVVDGRTIETKKMVKGK